MSGMVSFGRRYSGWTAAARSADREVRLLPGPDLIGQRLRPHVGQWNAAMLGQELGQRRISRQPTPAQRQGAVDPLPRLPRAHPRPAPNPSPPGRWAIVRSPRGTRRPTIESVPPSDRLAPRREIRSHGAPYPSRSMYPSPPLALPVGYGPLMHAGHSSARQGSGLQLKAGIWPY